MHYEFCERLKRSKKGGDTRNSWLKQFERLNDGC
jgi:hypothetical protein